MVSYVVSHLAAREAERLKVLFGLLHSAPDGAVAKMRAGIVGEAFARRGRQATSQPIRELRVRVGASAHPEWGGPKPYSSAPAPLAVESSFALPESRPDNSPGRWQSRP